MLPVQSRPSAPFLPGNSRDSFIKPIDVNTPSACPPSAVASEGRNSLDFSVVKDHHPLLVTTSVGNLFPLFGLKFSKKQNGNREEREKICKFNPIPERFFLALLLLIK